MDTNIVRRDPEGTRRRILDASAEHFSLHGPEGARVDAIAAAAGVNKRMLYHYFGDKEGLFQAALDDRAARFGGAADVENSRNTSGWDATTARLLVWAAGMEPEGEPAANVEQWAALAAQLADEQQRGRVRDDIEAGSAAMLYLAAAVLPALLPAHVRAIVGSADTSAFQDDVRKLVSPPTVSGGGSLRPRVRMQPQVRPR
jgi:AcrR family transcriptional regulator